MSKLLELASVVYFGSVSYLYFLAFTEDLSTKHGATSDEYLTFRKKFSSFGGRWKFLTHLNLFIHMIYFGLGMLNATLVLLGVKQNPLSRFLNFVYTSAIFPMGQVVGLCFWGIYLVDRNLIFPAFLDKIILPWHNHVMHTLPMLSPVGDNFFTEHKYEKSFVRGFAPLLALSIGYIIWLCIIAYYGNFWVYPFMKVIGPAGLGVFFVVTVFLAAFLYKLGEWINSAFWSQGSESSSKSKKAN